MQTKRSRLNIRQGREINGRRISSISLERVEYFEDARAHPLVVCTGLGGSARLDPLIEELAKDFHVTSWSSRGAGASIGNLTLGDHIMDLKYVIDTVNNESDERPYVYAHGFGAHALAKVLTLRDIAKKAVLAAPLIHPLEQNPAILNWYLKHTQEKQVLGGLFSLAAYVSRKLFLTRQSRDATWLAIDRQWFTEDSVLPFLDSIIDVEPVTGYFQSPTRVLLPGKSNFGFELRDISKIGNRWEEHGAQVVLCRGEDHNFSNGSGYFTTPRADVIVEHITRYFNQ